MKRPNFQDLLPALPDDMEEHDRRVRDRLAKERAERRATQVSLRRSLLKSSGFPGRGVDVACGGSFDCGSEAWHAVECHGDDPTEDASIVVLAGAVGVGKTVAACRWAASRSDSRPLFLRLTQFEAWSRYDKEARNRWESATSLVLDDLGTEWADIGENFLRDLDELIDHAYSRPIPTVLTTNLTAKQVRARYGERIYSRLSEAASWNNIRGGDRRRTA